jgi:hypothetical protein
MDGLAKLERAVLEKLLCGASDAFRILREQLGSLRVIDRELTGVGFWTNFAIGGGAEKLPGGPSFRFGDVVAYLDGLKHGAGFELLVEDGRLRMLEGYSFDEPWPDAADNFTLRYESGANRDEETVIKSFASA